nr:unnamed protein product [Digitaria exilis]
MVPTSVSPPPLRPPQVNMQKYQVALCQLLVSPDKEENLARARARIEAAADAGAMLIVMPASRPSLLLFLLLTLFPCFVPLFQEIWSCPYSLETLPSDAEDIDGGASPSISMLSEVAAARKITIVGGSIPEKASGKVFNTCCVIGPDGHILAKHRKLHLFEIDIPGDIKFKESDAFTGGQEPTVVDTDVGRIGIGIRLTDVGRIGIGICHDIRFPELAMLYRSRGTPRHFSRICIVGFLQLPFYPFHSIRAVDNQVGVPIKQSSLMHNLFWCYTETVRNIKMILNFFLFQLFVATCSPARDPDAKPQYIIWGHSSLIGPFGEVLAAAGHEETTAIGEIDLSMIQSTRHGEPPVGDAEQRRPVPTGGCAEAVRVCNSAINDARDRDEWRASGLSEDVPGSGWSGDA